MEEKERKKKVKKLEKTIEFLKSKVFRGRGDDEYIKSIEREIEKLKREN